MNTDKAHALTVPEEWDFRGIESAELKTAVLYEYMRENKAIRDCAVSWLDSKVGRVSFRETLLNGGEVPSSGFDFTWISQMMRDYPLFPLPWLAFEIEDRLDSCLCNYKPKAAQIIHIPSGSAFWSTMTPYEGLLLRIDWSRKTGDILKDLNTAVIIEAKKRKRLSGMGSSEPFHKLKKIAALRLHKAGLSYEKAQKFLKKNAPSANTDILPVYASQGAWHNAVNDAKSEVMSLSDRCFL